MVKMGDMEPPTGSKGRHEGFAMLLQIN
jgi:hypothetical protein